ncbi:MAG TPA: hypothetical protein PLC34_14760 [Burkholderiaceae bacterium]|nr:hypothetical protein [Burkholderiaceae bacterium]
MSITKALQARFPYMFEGREQGLALPRGWQPVFEALCEAIDRVLGPDKHGFQWTQIKEKFGVARMYFSLDGRSSVLISLMGTEGVSTFRHAPEDPDGPVVALRGQINELVSDATRKTGSLCALCGAPGKSDVHGGYVLTVCPQHAQDRMTGRFQQLWLEAWKDTP